MGKLKKLASLLLIAVMVMTMGVPAFAQESNNSYDFNSAANDDKNNKDDKHKDMSEDIQRILNGEDFVIGEGVELHSIDDGSITPSFGSGGTDHTHQYIVASALQVLKNDKGWTLLNNDTNAKSLLSNTDWPDVIGNETDYGTYSGHFYDPDTGKNWLGLTSPTALARANSYYNLAIGKYVAGDITSAIKYLGRGSHYVSDLSEPHHAANLTPLNSDHMGFESYVDDNRASFYISGNSLSSTVYSNSLSITLKSYLINAAKEAKALSPQLGDDTKYYSIGDDCVQNGITNVTMYFYRFCKETGLI